MASSKEEHKTEDDTKKAKDDNMPNSSQGSLVIPKFKTETIEEVKKEKKKKKDHNKPTKINEYVLKYYEIGRNDTGVTQPYIVYLEPKQVETAIKKGNQAFAKRVGLVLAISLGAILTLAILIFAINYVVSKM